MRRALGIDVGGSKMLACVVDEAGAIHGRQRRRTGRATPPDAALRTIGELVHGFRSDGLEFEGIGIGFPGLVDRRRGVARSTVMLDGWREVELAELVREATGVPCSIDNDVNAAAVAELRARDGGPAGGMLFVAVGTGIGGAIALEGRLWRGASGVAGEIGNISIDHRGETCWCGRRGCLNTLASGTAIEKRIGAAPGTLAEQTRNPTPEVRDALAHAAHHLGFGIANVMNLLNPQLVVLGGGIAQLGEEFLARVEERARREAFDEAAEGCSFELARGGYDAAAVGAALLVFEDRDRAEERS